MRPQRLSAAEERHSAGPAPTCGAREVCVFCACWKVATHTCTAVEALIGGRPAAVGGVGGSGVRLLLPLAESRACFPCKHAFGRLCDGAAPHCAAECLQFTL